MQAVNTAFKHALAPCFQILPTLLATCPSLCSGWLQGGCSYPECPLPHPPFCLGEDPKPRSRYASPINPPPSAPTYTPAPPPSAQRPVAQTLAPPPPPPRPAPLPPQQPAAGGPSKSGAKHEAPQAPAAQPPPRQQQIAQPSPQDQPQGPALSQPPVQQQLQQGGAPQQPEQPGLVRRWHVDMSQQGLPGPALFAMGPFTPEVLRHRPTTTTTSSSSTPAGASDSVPTAALAQRLLPVEPPEPAGAASSVLAPRQDTTPSPPSAGQEPVGGEVPAWQPPPPRKTPYMPPGLGVHQASGSGSTGSTMAGWLQAPMPSAPGLAAGGGAGATPPATPQQALMSKNPSPVTPSEVRLGAEPFLHLVLLSLLPRCRQNCIC